MTTRSFLPTVFRAAFIFGMLLLPWMLRAQEIPLERCDSLPVMEVKVGGQPMLFLVDTAATSILNLKSFAEGKGREVRVTSWSGTLATSAKEVTLKEVTVGSTRLLELKLPAIDLSAVGDTCGRKLDGILGVDLLAKLGATIDLKKQTVHVATVGDAQAAVLMAEMHREMHACLEAFNNSDEEAFGQCLDAKIVLFTQDADLYGREQVTGYFRDRYFHKKTAAKLEMHESAFHAIGDALWYEYEFSIASERGLMRGRGMAMCKKSEGRWRMASMHHSIVSMEPAAAAGK